MLTIILMVLGYIVIAGIVTGIIDDQTAIVGLFWPISVPVLIVISIVKLIASGVEFLKDCILKEK